MHTLLKSHSEDPLSNSLLADKNDHVSALRAGISPRLRQKLLYMHVSSYDWEQGGLLTPIKFLDRDSVEYSLSQTALHDRNEERMARLSLTKGMELLDPEAGGIFQFATQNGWQQCHYSKSIAAQAGSLRLYALAYALLREHSYLHTARNIHDYLCNELLSEAGVFRSTPADSVIRIDKYKSAKSKNSGPIKTRENGWAVEALGSYCEFTGDQSAVNKAEGALERIRSQRLLSNGGFSSDEPGNTSLHLSDNLAMARAFLQLYRVTTDSRYLHFAEDSAAFICSDFINPAGGFNSRSNVDTEQNNRQIDENICLGRFLNLLHYYTGNNEFIEQARHGLRYLAIPQVATSRMEEAGILLLDEELSCTPMKITIMGDRNDRKAIKLHQGALRSFGWYKVIHWQDANTN